MGIRSFARAMVAAVVMIVSPAMAGVVRDPLGSEYTDGQPGAWAFDMGSFYGYPGAVFTTPPQSGKLGLLTVTAYGNGGAGDGTPENPHEPDWLGATYEIYVWANGAAGFITDPTNPAPASYIVPEESFSVSPDIVGTYVDPTFGVHNQRNLEFDLSALSIAVDVDHEYVVAVVMHHGSSEMYVSLSSWEGPLGDQGDVYASVTEGGGGGTGPGYVETLPGWPGEKWFAIRVAIIICGDGLCEGDEPTTCPEDCNSIPAVSTWGMVAMTLLVLTAGTLIHARRFTVRQPCAQYASP